MKTKKILSLMLIFTFISTGAFAQTKTYTVKPGDTVYKIAAKNNLTVNKLMSANPKIKNSSQIYAGQRIQIPSSPKSSISQNTATNTSPSYTLSAYEKEVIRLCNLERSKRGLSPFKTNVQLSALARLKAQDMATKGYFSHTSPTYGSPFKMISSHGIAWKMAAENIAYGQRTPASVVTAWMNSPGHRANILSPRLNQIGVGYATNKKGVPYWSQMFIQTWK